MSEISGGSSEYPSTRSFTSQASEDDPVRTGLDLVSAARRNLRFLRYVADSDWFRNSYSLLHAIRRYEELWMPLICDLTVEGDPHPPMILPPIDVEWVWYCHSLNPVEYRKYCERKFSKLIGKAAIFDEENEDYAVNKCREIWRKRYPNEPFENEFSDSDDQSSLSYGGMKASSNDLAEASERDVIMREMGKQKDVYERYFREPYMGEIMYLIAAKRRYKKMLQMVMGQLQDHQGPPISIFIPTVDILLMWLTHQSYPTVYAADTKHMEDETLTKVVGPWDSLAMEKDIEETKRIWEATFDQPYEKAGGGIATSLGGGNDPQNLFCWAVSDSDVNIKYKSLRPRHLLEVCVFVRLDSQKDATLPEKTREFLRLQMLRSHKELKLDKPITNFPTDTWLKAWHLYCEFGTKGIMLELRHSGSLCFTGTGLLDGASVMWNELLRAPSLAIGREIDQKIRSFTSITPPVQAPYLLKCVPDRVTDDSGAMISDVMLKLNHYRPQEGRWLSRTVLDHSGRECFVVRIRVGEGFWRRGGESPETVRWEDRIIEIQEGSWSYVDNSAIGRAPDKVVGTAKPKEEAKEGRTAWSFSTGDELAIQWESTGSLATLSFILDNQDPDSSVMLLKGRKMQYQMTPEEKRIRHKTDHEAEEEEEGFVTLVRFSEDNPNGKATALLNWKLLAAEILPEEDAVFVLLLCFAILRTVSEMRKEDVGGLLIRRRLKETKHGLRDWGSVILHPSSYPCSSPPSLHVQPWYWNPKAVLARDHGVETAVSPAVLGSSLAEGGDKLYKKGIIT